VIASRQIEKALFETALNIAEPAARDAFLAKACAGDAPQRARVEAWLDAREAAEDFFQTATQARVAAVGETLTDTAAAALVREGEARPAVAEDGPGTRVGRYKLIERIGEGGCGVVYLAEQREPVRRRVALKVIRLGMDTESVIARFEMERQALALMDHPNIAHVLDAGATEAGRPYFVMELVHGAKITEYCEANRVGTRERLELMIQVCQAIQHAHQKGIIHRDIKPSNILVSLQDGVAVPKVIDFGIARAIEGRLLDNTLFTARDQFVGTPAYMSPEQAEGGLDLDTRSDVYSLGVLLYELLAGRTPFDSKKLAEAGMFEMLRTLREEEPLPPSVLLAGFDADALAAVANQHQVESGRLVKLVGGDLDGIVLKAMAKDRRLRYDTVNGLASDLRRFLSDEPVVARLPSRLDFFRKLVRRNKVIFAAGAAVAVALMAGMGASTWFFFQERQARLEQARLRREAEAARASEAGLLRESKARGNVSLAAILLTQGKTKEADALLAKTPLTTIEPSKEAVEVFRSLGEWNGIYGRWKQAADSYARCLQASRLDDPNKPTFSMVELLAAAPVFLEAGDGPGYERLREEALARFGNTTDLGVCDQLVKACLLQPADRAMLERLLTRRSWALMGSVPKGAATVSDLAFGAMSQALLKYRRDDFPGALLWSQRCLAYEPANEARSAGVHALAALAGQRSGQPELARSELVKARELLARLELAKAGKLNPDLLKFPRGNGEGYWFDWSIARLLEREAAALIDRPSQGDKAPR
jgi:serine/threonine protein kinase